MWAAQNWINLGAPASKLAIGLAMYGRSFTLAGTDISFGAAISGAGPAQQYTGEPGYISYTEV